LGDFAVALLLVWLSARRGKRTSEQLASIATSANGASVVINDCSRAKFARTQNLGALSLTDVRIAQTTLAPVASIDRVPSALEVML
jgi:hypothetical protein